MSDYIEYVPLDPSEMRTKADQLARMFRSYATEAANINLDDVKCSKDGLLEIIERVEKRRVYFKVFYGLEMSERNEASLYCFWLLKLAPLFYLKNPSYHINAAFALHLFLKMITYASPKKVAIPTRHIEHILYAFKFRDVSKESIMAIAETILCHQV